MFALRTSGSAQVWYVAATLGRHDKVLRSDGCLALKGGHIREVAIAAIVVGEEPGSSGFQHETPTAVVAR